MNTTGTLEIPLRTVGLLLRLLSLGAGWYLLLFTVPVGAFLFWARSTLSSVSSRTKHWNSQGFLLLYFTVQDLVYSHFSSEDQVLKILLMVVVLSDSGLGLFSLLLRTKYQISHTVERLISGAASLSGSKNSSHLFVWEHFWVNRVLSIPST